MYALVARREEYDQPVIGGNWEITEEIDIIALFDSKEGAEDYIEKSKLAQPIRINYGGNKVFRSHSLLGMYQEAWVEPYEKDCYPINPTL